MRPSDRQLEMILERADTLRRRQAARRTVRADAIGAALCAALLCAVFAFLPAPEAAAGGGAQYGSLILGVNAAGAVICVLSFVLGVCVTLLCTHWRRLKRMEREEHEH